MKIIIATPLYPPEISTQATYVKELAKRLAKNHSVTVIAYGRLPEKVPGVSFVSVDKRRPLIVRLLHYTFALWRKTRRADILYSENGASVELPAGLVTLFTHCPLIMHVGDKAAHERTAQNALLRHIERFTFRQARKIVVNIPLERPEILPFREAPQREQDAYNKSWDAHIHLLKEIFEHV